MNSITPMRQLPIINSVNSNNQSEIKDFIINFLNCKYAMVLSSNYIEGVIKKLKDYQKISEISNDATVALVSIYLGSHGQEYKDPAEVHRSIQNAIIVSDESSTDFIDLYYVFTDEEILFKKYNNFLDHAPKFLNGSDMLKLVEILIHNNEKIPVLLVIKAFQLTVNLTKLGDSKTIQALKELINAYYTFCTLPVSLDKIEYKYIIAPLIVFFKKFYISGKFENIKFIDTLIEKFFVNSTPGTALVDFDEINVQQQQQGIPIEGMQPFHAAKKQKLSNYQQATRNFFTRATFQKLNIMSAQSSLSIMDIDELDLPLEPNILKRKRDEECEQVINFEMDLYATIKVEIARHVTEFFDALITRINIQIDEFISSAVNNSIHIISEDIRESLKIIFFRGFNGKEISYIIDGLKDGDIIIKAINDFAINISYCDILIEQEFSMEDICNILYRSGANIVECLKAIKDYSITFEKLFKMGCRRVNIVTLLCGSGSELPIALESLSANITTLENLVKLGFTWQSITEMYNHLNGRMIAKFTGLIAEYMQIFARLVGLGFNVDIISDLLACGDYAVKVKVLRAFSISIGAFEYLIQNMRCKCKQFRFVWKTNAKGCVDLAGNKNITYYEVKKITCLRKIEYIEPVKGLVDQLKILIKDAKLTEATVKYILSKGISRSEGVSRDVEADINIILQYADTIEYYIGNGHTNSDIVHYLRRALTVN